jgi:predicted alpha/beta-fold hydrolase
MSDFSPPWWLRNPHAQTVWGRLARSRQLVNFRREVLRTPDDDDLILDHLDAPSPRVRFILMHGLEGSTYSVYIQGLLSIIARHGHSATAINFRSCARDPRRIENDLPNRRPRLYHSGETTDFDFVLRTLAARPSAAPLVALGASLGGNVLLKWLGEHPDQTFLSAGATMSVPYDLGAGSRHLETGAGRLYVASFLSTLKRKVKDVVRRSPETARIVDVDAALRARTFRELDDAATGPLHNMKDADDYYNTASSIYYLDRITTPTLCVSAEDDPFLPHEALQRALKVASGAVEFRTTTLGGHVGFVAGAAPWRCTYWAEELIVDWLVAHALGTPHAATA